MSDAQRIGFLRELREARALLLRDSESFHVAATALEHIGQAVRASIGKGLNDYRNPIVNFATQNGDFDWNRVEMLFDTVQQARNDAVHGGAYVRQLASRLDELFLILQQACMKTLRRARDLMVDRPTYAEPWQNVNQIRRSLLANSFSYIPVRTAPEKEWFVVSDLSVLRFLRGANRERRSELLSLSILEAVEGPESGEPSHSLLTVESPPKCGPGEFVEEIQAKMNHLPMLVVENADEKERLVGIITPFDLL